MPPKNSMLDDDFLDEDVSDDFSFRDDPVEREFDVSDKDDKKEPDLEIEVQSDVPDKDKGKWVADPEKDGEPEIPSEDELKNYGKRSRDRINQLTARVNAERRRADDRERQLAEAVKVAEGLLKQSNQLSDLVENGEKVLIGEHKSRLETQLNLAKQAYREAHEAGDPNGMIAAQENIAKSAAALDRLSVHQPSTLPRAKEEDLRKQFTPPQRVNDETQEWAAKNAHWFQKDQLMTSYAWAVHKNLTEQQGIKPTDPAYFKSIDKEMRTRFPEKFGTPRRTQTVVASADRVGRSEGGKLKVTLTESQVKLARRLGLTNEQYAREVVKQNQGT